MVEGRGELCCVGGRVEGEDIWKINLGEVQTLNEHLFSYLLGGGLYWKPLFLISNDLFSASLLLR